MSKLSQLLKMIKILEGAKEPIKRKDIAKSLGVSERMIRKYIDDLKLSGYNVISTSGRNGGLQLEQEQEQSLSEYEKFYLEILLDENKKEVIKEIKLIEGTLPTTQKYYETIKKHLEKQIETIETLKIKLKL